MGIKKILLIIIGVGFLLALMPFVSPRGSFTEIYMILNWVLPALLLLLVAITLFSSQGYKNVRLAGSAFKTVVDTIIRIFLIILTAVVSWVVLAFIGFSNGSYSMSTYGTPIYRPKTK